MNSPRHFLDISEVESADLRNVLNTATAIKTGERNNLPMAGKTLAMIFEKPSTRTRVSFEVGAKQLGGSAIIMNAKEMQLGRGESISDTAKVLSRYVDVIMIRTDAHQKLIDLAQHATVPVINGLTDESHPCQVMADVMTIEEHRGSIAGKRLAYCGDAANNMGRSLIHAAVRFDFELNLACPDEFRPANDVLGWAQERQGRVRVASDPVAMVTGADVVITDTWVSMGDKDADRRHALLEPFRVNSNLMSHAKSDALFLHDLPAHRGEEVVAEIIDGPQSVIFDEAENRLHAQKAILAWCLSD